MTEVAQPVGRPTTLANVLITAARLLTFRASTEELILLNRKHLLFGLLCTWVVGIGRYWDNPRVPLLQHLGLGSIIYVFALAFLLWALLWPIRPQHWSYFRVLTFVSLVSPPAILYAIPVEKLYPVDTANGVNLLFLAIVSAWRVALLFFFLRRLGGLGWFTIFVAALLPLTLIVVTLTMLNLEQAALDLMGGLTKTASDASYQWLIMLSMLSIIMFIPILICYLVLAYHSLTETKRQTQENDSV